MSDNFIKSELFDKSGNIKKLLTKIDVGGGEININVDGYTEDLIMLEIWEGELRLVVWADGKTVEPTHIIGLEPAKKIIENNC